MDGEVADAFGPGGEPAAAPFLDDDGAARSELLPDPVDREQQDPLVDEVAADLDGAVERVVADILSGGPEAVREAKRLVLEPGEEEDLLARASGRRAGEEGQEGLRAFLEKRPPAWLG